MTDPHPRQKVISLLRQEQLDAVVFCQPENLRYLCGFTGSDGVLVATPERLVFLTDSRYTTQANDEVTADDVAEYKNKAEAVAAQLTALQAKRIGHEAGLTVGLFKEFCERGASDWEWVLTKEAIQQLRLHKTAWEIAEISAAADLNLDAFTDIAPMIRPDARESDIALALEFALRNKGAEEKAFDIIVASGVRGAMPHGVASDKPIAEGELVTIDFGCRRSGYHSDETVTFAVGAVSEPLRRIFDTVETAQKKALDAVKPGVALAELDRIARAHIEDCGFGRYFGHGLGHGIGLEVHEAPVVSPRSQMVAEEGMVFSIEPGIYVPDLGGVRIEDLVAVTATGKEILTKIPKTFRNILLN